MRDTAPSAYPAVPTAIPGRPKNPHSSRLVFRRVRGHANQQGGGLGDGSHPSPAVAGGCMFLVGQKSVFCIGR